MNSDFDYAQACIPDRWAVLGCALLPFSVGHNLLLERVQSPFAISGQINLQDLILAVKICERDYEAGEYLLAHGNTLGLRLFSWRATWKAALNKKLLETHAEAFAEYLKQGIQKPKNIWKDSAAELTYAPNVGITVRDLMNHYGYSRSEVLNMPMRQAVFERYLILERDKTITWKEPWEMGAA